MAFMGVRNSWLILAKKLDLALLASSAVFLALRSPHGIVGAGAGFVRIPAGCVWILWTVLGSAERLMKFVERLRLCDGWTLNSMTVSCSASTMPSFLRQSQALQPFYHGFCDSLTLCDDPRREFCDSLRLCDRQDHDFCDSLRLFEHPYLELCNRLRLCDRTFSFGRVSGSTTILP